ncbi:MAG: deoxynucleoside kinase [Candidatus Delongbacteria bacterium]|nr:deoxynucleoside kinase [Candidatus Delongbacteria bacterium]
MKKLYVAMAGNFGAGKTTLTRMIAEHYHWEPYYEPVVDNPYLDDFYGDMKRWSFHLQIYFLAKRFQSLIEIQQNDISVIQDRTIYEDVEIFARNLFRRGEMTERDFQTYSDLFYDMVSFISKPDLVIYLRARPEVLVERIMHRGRQSEKNIPIGYLKQLNEAYEMWIATYSGQNRVLIVDSETFDPNSDQTILELIDDEIQTMISEPQQQVSR